MGQDSAVSGVMKISRSAKWLAVAATLALAAGLAACSQGFPATTGSSTGTDTPGIAAGQPTNGLVQANTDGSVAIDVKWAGEEKGSLTFEVSMDTHSEDLDGDDLSKLALLRDDTGKEYRPLSWVSAPGGHHRSGTLTLPVPAGIGQAKYLELVIKDVAKVGERVLRWQLS